MQKLQYQLTKDGEILIACCKEGEKGRNSFQFFIVTYNSCLCIMILLYHILRKDYKDYFVCDFPQVW